MSPGTEELAGSSNAHVQEVVKAAEEDLRQLIRPRADILKRIGTIKQTMWDWPACLAVIGSVKSYWNWSVGRADHGNGDSPRPVARC